MGKAAIDWPYKIWRGVGANVIQVSVGERDFSTRNPGAVK